MTTTVLSGFVVRETENAVAFVADTQTRKPLWIPRKKIAEMTELFAPNVPVQLEGENIQRSAIPFMVEAETAFLQKVGAV